MDLLDFFQIAVKEKKGGGLEAYPDFIVGRSKDLMVRAKNFYAIWDEGVGLWSTDEYDVQRIVDARLRTYAEKNKDIVGVKYMRNFSSNGQSTFRKFMTQIGDNAHQLDEKLTFQSTPVKKEDYVSKRLPYDLAPGDISAWNEMVGTLYKPEERAKIEWFIGAIVSGDSKLLQKFIVLYGPPGAGKGTIIDVITLLFDTYTTTFDAKALGSNGNQFAAAAFSGNPLVAIQHDGDLSGIADNTILNSIVSHEIMKVNEKYKPAYDSRINAALVMGTNKPVKITDAQSGLIRRLIDVHPSGDRLPPTKYHELKAKIGFELGAIAHHCLTVYKKMGKNYYSNYQPLEMMYQTDIFFNFIETYYDVFSKQNGVSAKQAWNLYKEYCEEANIDKSKSLQLHRFRAELGNYFEKFHEKITLDGVAVRSYFQGFKAQPFKTPVDDDKSKMVLRMDQTSSLLNLELAECPAQYSKADGSPTKYWDDSERMIRGEMRRPTASQIVSTYLRDLDPKLEHFVKPPSWLIVVDFDLTDENGEKSLELNLEAAAAWPATYAELSKSGKGVHLHYRYDGDISQLDPAYADGIEIKVFAGNSALRRRLSKCNDVPIATISSGLPLKEKKRVLDEGSFKSQKGLRDFIAKNLRKEYHPGTKSSIDFIKKGLDDAYEDGLAFDVTDLKPRIIAFANNSTNQALNALKVVSTMRWKSDPEILDEPEAPPAETDPRLVLFDVEVYPNLFVICWKFENDSPDKDQVVRMINPKPHEVQALLKFKLVGFNNRNYDNHILWAAALGYSIEQLYQLSTKIVNNVVGQKFGEAYNVSHTDVYDFSTDKKGLKKWQIQLGLDHREMDIPWDQPVPEDRIMDVVDYCTNDVLSLEFVFKYLKGDYNARCILSDLSGLTPNHTTANHTARIVFGKDKNPQKSFVYTDLSKEFPGYVFGPKDGVQGNPMVSTYRGETVGEGGYVYAEPGLYRDVALLDVASMHPTSIGQLNLFGEYTPRFMALVEAQLAIKNGRYADAKGYFDGKLTPYIEEIETLRETDPAAAKKAAADLRWGLKIAINIVYGLTSAKFDNPFKDWRNKDNIVAKRGALFMIDLKHFIQERGFRVVHIKTDSVKIPGADQPLIDEVMRFGEKYGYAFEHEATYAKFGLVNDAVYVAKKDGCDISAHSVYNPETACWSATGSQFQHPYVFKTLFGYQDDIHFNDLCETKHVQQGSIYLDFGYHYEGGDGEGANMGYVNHWLALEKIAEKAKKKHEKTNHADDLTVYLDKNLDLKVARATALNQLIHVGKTGRFTPVVEGNGGGQLWRIKDEKPYAVSGTKGHLWVDSNLAMNMPNDAIDYGFFDRLVDEARANLVSFVEASDFESVEEFVS